jgi:hypothetical protein
LASPRLRKRAGVPAPPLDRIRTRQQGESYLRSPWGANPVLSSYLPTVTWLRQDYGNGLFTYRNLASPRLRRRAGGPCCPFNCNPLNYLILSGPLY